MQGAGRASHGHRRAYAPAVLTYRPATEGDYPFVLRAHHEGMRDVVVATWGPWDEAVQDRFTRESFDEGQHEIVEEDGRPVGYRIVQVREDHVALAMILIVPAHQGRGLGTQAVRDIQALAARRQLPVRLTVLRANSGAKALYKRLGFVDVDEDELYFTMEWRGA